MNRQEKGTLVNELKSKIEGKNFVLLGFDKLSVSEIEEIRTKLRQTNCSLNVVKNTLISITLKEMGLETLDEFLEKTTILAVQNDSSSFDALKVIAKYAKDNDKFFVKCGRIEGKKLSADEVLRISDLPSKPVLIAKLLSRLNAPISRLVYTLNAPITNLVYALNAIKAKKEGI